MIAVSNGWRAAQNQILLPEMFVEITYMVTEPGLQEKASASGSSPEDFSNVGQIVSNIDKHSEAYAALDYGCWGLDGSFGYFDGTPEDPGYVDTTYSSADCTMDVHSVITITFPERQSASIPGIMIDWNAVFGCWATEFIVTAHNAGGIVAQAEVTDNNSPSTIIWLDMMDYSKITLEVLKWSHPYQRVRCMEVLMGIKNVYTKTDLLGYDHKQSVDLLSAALPHSSITFKLRNDDNRWNPNNPTGSEKYLMEQQEVRVRYGMDVNGTVEWIPGGTYWLSEWSTPANGMEAIFTAGDAVEFMGNTYEGIRSGTLYDIAVAALTEATLPTTDSGGNRYVVAEILKNYTTDFSGEDTEYVVSEVLQMVAHAGGCVFYQDRDGVVHIEPWNKHYSGYMIEPAISYAHPEYTINKPLKALSVGYGTEKQRAVVDVAAKGEIQTIDNPFLVTEDDALRVANAAKNILENRKVISGEFRADLRMDVLDGVIVTSKYASNIMAVTEVNYSTSGGAFKGAYTGRVISITLEPEKRYVGEFYIGEVTE